VRLLGNIFRTTLFRLFITAKALISPTAFGVAGVVIGEDGKVLLVRHRYMTGWQLPGGGVDRAEPPEQAIRRELGEEVGLTGGIVTFLGLYTRGAGWATNVVALYRVTGGTIAFRPSLEIRQICFAEPEAPPSDTTAATLRRLAELGGAAVSPYW
jgi:8-oxo-dGTP pyrophosphatase MutT (NUDIX family)